MLEEARASYAEGAVVELQNNAPADLEALLGRDLSAWKPRPAPAPAPAAG